MEVSGIQKTRRLDWPLIAFLGLAYSLAWGMIPLLAAIARQAGLPDWTALSARAEVLDFAGLALPVSGWVVYLLTRVQDFAFSIAGVIMIVYLHGRSGLRELTQRLVKWRIGWRVWLVALLPLGLYLVATAASTLLSPGVSGALGSFTFNGRTLSAILFSAEAGLLVTLFLRGPMGEELGLRGFALPWLQARMSPFQASVIIGILWAAWHLPVLVSRDVVSIVAFLLLAFILSFIFTWLFNGSGGSLLPGLLFHAIQNTEEMFETLFPGLIGTDWELGSTLGLLVMGIAFGIIVWRNKSW